MKNIYWLLSLLMIITSAFASSWEQKAEYLVLFRFGSTYNGKAVQRVTAYVGAYFETKTDIPSPSVTSHSWFQSQQVVLSPTNGHFFQKLKFVTDGFLGEAGYNLAKGIAVYYVVTFTDGSRPAVTQDFITSATVSPGPLPSTPREISDAESLFNQATDAGAMSVVVLDIGSHG